jgi:hypothetical protein
MKILWHCLRDHFWGIQTCREAVYVTLSAPQVAGKLKLQAVSAVSLRWLCTY